MPTFMVIPTTEGVARVNVLHVIDVQPGEQNTLRVRLVNGRSYTVRAADAPAVLAAFDHFLAAPTR